MAKIVTFLLNLLKIQIFLNIQTYFAVFLRFVVEVLILKKKINKGARRVPSTQFREKCQNTLIARILERAFSP